MKKSTKIVLSIIGGLFLSGIVLMLIGVAAGGSVQAKEIVVSGGNLDSDFVKWYHKLIGINPLPVYDYSHHDDIDTNDNDSDHDNNNHDVYDDHDSDNHDSYNDHDSYDHNESNHYQDHDDSDDTNHHTGEEKYHSAAASYGTEIGNAKEVDALDFALGAGSFEIRPSQDDGIYVQYTDPLKVTTSVKNGTLHVEAKKKNNHITFWGVSIGDSNTGSMVVYLPQKEYDRIDLDLGAGVLEVEETLNAQTLCISIGAGEMECDILEAQKMELTVAAGEAQVEKIEAGHADMSVDMGELEIDLARFEELSLVVGMGQAEIHVDGSEKETNYQAECGMGEITIGSFSAAGLASEKEKKNDHCKRFIQAECGMGQIEITFSDKDVID